MRLIRLGAIAAVVGLVGALVNFWASREFPTTWGGPNIGGGILQLLFYGLILAGITLAIVGGLTGRRRD
ncbi:hypothetical protein [Catellatospora sichuanensis]|uniref:hypothetical protein n=1 Tax=Catellatospora sichuanensis TaxID=1969805 RepID=UPI001182CBAE|nr:hypothetical protein [Catellatospora sichuanensis]